MTQIEISSEEFDRIKEKCLALRDLDGQEMLIVDGIILIRSSAVKNLDTELWQR